MIIRFGTEHNINRTDATRKVKTVYPKRANVYTGGVIRKIVRGNDNILADVLAINLLCKYIVR